jgi:hypothetical protein
VVRGDRCRDGGSASGDEIGGVAGRDVLEDDFERRVTRQQGLQHALDENSSRGRNVARRVGHFAVHE